MLILLKKSIIYTKLKIKKKGNKNRHQMEGYQEKLERLRNRIMFPMFVTNVCMSFLDVKVNVRQF